jgi:hypothetical protein
MGKDGFGALKCGVYPECTICQSTEFMDRKTPCRIYACFMVPMMEAIEFATVVTNYVEVWVFHGSSLYAK